MTWDQLSQLSWDEISNLTWDDVILEPTKLLQRIVTEYDANDIPSSVLIKLQKMCYSLEEVCENNNIEAPSPIKSIKSKSIITKIEILSIISSIITILQFIEPKQPTVVNNYNNTYIINVYPNEIQDIIEDLEQIDNTHINIINNPTNTSIEENSQDDIYKC